MSKDGRSLDYPQKNVDHKRLSELSENDYFKRVFEVVEGNEEININELAKKLKTTSTSFIGNKVSEFERQRVLDVRYLGNNRFLSVAETKAAGSFKKLVQKSFK